MENNIQGSTFKWRHPQEVMQLHQLKKRKKALQARINSTISNTSQNTNNSNELENIIATKRKNPFLKNSDCKRSKSDSSPEIDMSSDTTLFKLLHCSSTTIKNTDKENITSFTNILNKVREINEEKKTINGGVWIPIDWSLKSKVRFMSLRPFPWNQKLKINEEASGITSFTRCLDVGSKTNLDTSSNAKFHQCCLYWQQPCLPWLTLFPRTLGRVSKSGTSIATNPAIRESLQSAWTDSLRSLFQLIRTRQCPYFYVCTNSFTVLIRAAGISGFNEMNAIVTPTTRGFRHLLRQEDIEFKMPLKKQCSPDAGYETLNSTSSFQTNDSSKCAVDDESPDEEWLQSMGIDSEDIKQINYTQARIEHRAECEIDNSDESLILIEGLEVQAFYNFLLNCKSITQQVGPLAGIPPTLIAPVAFHGASLSALKVRESKVHIDNEDYYSLELTGPILPHVIHNLYAMNPPQNDVSATFTNLNSTVSFSKVKYRSEEDSSENENRLLTCSGSAVFKKENLSDCGFNKKVLENFCSEDPSHIENIECLKYTVADQKYSWT